MRALPTGGIMAPRLAVLALAVLAAAAGSAAACDLRLEPSSVFGGTCQVLVGYDGTDRIGPFHIMLPDHSAVTAGNCDGYVGVAKVEGNVITLQPFHTVPARVYRLSDDCSHTISVRTLDNR
jgi:hypothetical protein